MSMFEAIVIAVVAVGIIFIGVIVRKLYYIFQQNERSIET